MSTPNRLKRVAIIVAAIALLLVTAAAILVATVDVNRYKPDIAEAVKARTGRTLRFDGDLSLALFPSIGVKLPATTLSERGRDAVFAQLGSAQASVALLPLLGGRVTIDSVRIDGLKANIVRQPDGRTNIDDLLGRTSGAPAPATEPSKPQAAATVGEVELRNADLTWRDLGAKRTVRLAAFDLKAGRYAPGARMPIDASADVTSSDPALVAKVSLDAEVIWADDGSLQGVRDLAFKADGRLDDRPLTLDMQAERLVAAAESLDVDRLKATVNATTTDGPLELRLSAPRLSVNPQQASGQRIDVTLARRGANPLEASLALAELRGNAKRLEASSVKLAAQSRVGERRTTLDGTLPMIASVEQRTLQIEGAALNLVVEDAALAPKPLRFPLTASAAIDGRRETVALRLESRADGLNGRMRLDLAGFERRRVTFDVDAEHVDVDRIWPAPRAASAPAPGAGGKGAASAPADTRVDLSALRTVSGSGSVRIGRLQARGIDAAEVRATAKAADGRIDVAPLSGRIYGGSVNGRIGIDARANRIATSGNASGIQLRRAVGNVSRRVAVEGSASGSFDLAAAGVTLNQMKRALNGTLAVDVRNGAIVGIDLNDIVGSAGTFLQSRNRQAGALDERRRTEFKQLTGSARIKDGVAVNDDLKAQTQQLTLSGSGRLDIASSELDYTLRALVSAVPAGSPGALRALAGVTVPVKLSGPLDNVGYSVDWSAVATEALVRRATGGAGTPAVNELIEGLGGLLRGRKK